MAFDVSIDVSKDMEIDMSIDTCLETMKLKTFVYRQENRQETVKLFSFAEHVVLVCFFVELKDLLGMRIIRN
jgi:hypothetical protein